MIIHFIRIALIATILVVCMFLPFFPGNYDALAVTVSFMAQLSGIAGLLLVLTGLPWFIHEFIKRKNTKRGPTNNNTTYYFAIVSLVASCLVAIVVALGAFGNNNFFLGTCIIVFSVYIVSTFISGIRQMRNVSGRSFNPTPLYLICIPLIVLLFRFLFIIPATEFSRNYAIKKSENLIQDIEAYHNRNGNYPTSLLSLWKDYEPSVIGIEQYHYEPHGKAYNLYFEQFTYQLDIKEIVMYNKLNEHVMTSHDMDILQLTPGELNVQRGYVAVRDLPNVHWKYFWFD